MLVRFSEVTRAFGAFEVLNGVSFQINKGDRLGLVGPNGSGKTTLLNLIEKPSDADVGTVERASGLRLGRLDQAPNFGATCVIEEALGAFSDVRAIEGRLRELEAQMESDPPEGLLGRYADLQHEFEHRGGYTYRSRAEASLLGLGFDRGQFPLPASSLSGGEKNRLSLARLLLAEVDLLLLDEPTNHLDVRSIEWLEHFLISTAQTLLVVSHDRFFLDRVIDQTLELERGRLLRYRGNYSSFVKQRAERRDREERAWKKQQEWIEKTEDYIRRNIAGQKTRQAQSRRRALSKAERVERPVTASPAVRFRFREPARSRRCVLRTEDLAAGHAGHSVLTNVTLHIERGERWAILGPNGSGKTTLLATIAGRLDLLSGRLDRNESRFGYYDQELTDLDPETTVIEEMRDAAPGAADPALRDYLAGFAFRGEAVRKYVRDLSGGERSRLVLARIIYQSPPLLFLDEPTNHLDITSREALETALSNYPGTLVFVTHDRRLVERTATHVVYVGERSARVFDSFPEFQQWLTADIDAATRNAAASRPVERSPRPGKNRQAQAERETKRLETSIETVEGEIRRMEAVFQNPPPDLEWDAVNREYAELKEELDSLYSELAELLDRID